MSQAPINLPHTLVLGYLSRDVQGTRVRQLARVTLWTHAPILALVALGFVVWGAVELYYAYQDYLSWVAMAPPWAPIAPPPPATYLRQYAVQQGQWYAFLVFALLALAAWRCAAWTKLGHPFLHWLGPIVLVPTVLFFAFLAAVATVIPFFFGIESVAFHNYNPWAWCVLVGLPIFAFLALLTMDLISCVRWIARNGVEEINVPIFKLRK